MNFTGVVLLEILSIVVFQDFDLRGNQQDYRYSPESRDYLKLFESRIYLTSRQSPITAANRTAASLARSCDMRPAFLR